MPNCEAHRADREIFSLRDFQFGKVTQDLLPRIELQRAHLDHRVIMLAALETY